MAATERVTLSFNSVPSIDTEQPKPGLRISIRSTTSSLPDYPEWNLLDLHPTPYDAVVTDGSCS